MVVIKEIIPGSLAEEMGIKPKDRLLEINGHRVDDMLGIRFWGTDSDLRISIRRDGITHLFECDKDPDEELGVVAEEMRVRCCGSHCIFCYVDQLPEALRAPLYVKDEDYRLSFLHGNYVTLTNLKRKDFQRIISERLSPLYVSVHATNPEVRQRMLGLRGPDSIMDIMGGLVDEGIKLHTQIVICPGWNDGEVLERTVQDLERLIPGVASISLVPVGLTKHRKGLEILRQLTVREAEDIIDLAKRWQQRFLDQFGMRVIFPSDELLLMVGARIPGETYYEDFPQVENGVGLIRSFLHGLKKQVKRLPAQIPKTAISLVTGALAAPILQERLVPKLQKVRGLTVNVVTVHNQLLGDGVTVSGLLGGKDIWDALELHGYGDVVVLPPNIINDDSLFLDDLSLSEFQRRLGVPVYVYDENFPEILKDFD